MCTVEYSTSRGTHSFYCLVKPIKCSACPLAILYEQGEISPWYEYCTVLYRTGPGNPAVVLVLVRVLDDSGRTYEYEYGTVRVNLMILSTVPSSLIRPYLLDPLWIPYGTVVGIFRFYCLFVRFRYAQSSKKARSIYERTVLVPDRNNPIYYQGAKFFTQCKKSTVRVQYC